ncbi:MAG: hypothetical protein R3A11_08455 [Bdellovibrionota bacterium]
MYRSVDAEHEIQSAHFNVGRALPKPFANSFFCLTFGIDQFKICENKIFRPARQINDNYMPISFLLDEKAYQNLSSWMVDGENIQFELMTKSTGYQKWIYKSQTHLSIDLTNESESILRMLEEKKKGKSIPRNSSQFLYISSMYFEKFLSSLSPNLNVTIYDERNSIKKIEQTLQSSENWKNLVPYQSVETDNEKYMILDREIFKTGVDIENVEEFFEETVIKETHRIDTDHHLIAMSKELKQIYLDQPKYEPPFNAFAFDEVPLNFLNQAPLKKSQLISIEGSSQNQKYCINSTIIDEILYIYDPEVGSLKLWLFDRSRKISHHLRINTFTHQVQEQYIQIEPLNIELYSDGTWLTMNYMDQTPFPYGALRISPKQGEALYSVVNIKDSSIFIQLPNNQTYEVNL